MPLHEGPALVLCMTRFAASFRKAGYTTPHALLPLGGQTILAHLVAGLRPSGPLILVTHEADRPHEAALRSQLPARARVHFLPSDPGRASRVGARLLLESGDDGPAFFHDGGAIVSGRDLEAIAVQLHSQAEAFVDVFDHGIGGLTYLSTAERSIAPGLHPVRGIAGQVVVSRNAASGLFGVRSAEAFLSWSADTNLLGEDAVRVGEILRGRISSGAQVIANPGHAGDTVLVNQPVAYEVLVGGGG
jgi:hypothetical protein